MRASADSRHDEIARQIAWAAEARPGFDLFFVVANTHAAREGFARALGAAVPDLATLDLPEEPVRFLDLVRELPDAHTVLVTGLEPHARAALARGSLFGGMNLDRDAIRREERNLVFLLPSFALDALAQAAPDFYDFRTVALEVAEVGAAEDLPSPHKEFSVLALNPRDRERWIEILRSMDAQTYSSKAQIQVQLSRLLRERGDLSGAENVLRGLLADLGKNGLDPQQLGWIVNDLGLVFYVRGDLSRAFEAFSQARVIAEEGNDEQGLASTISNMGLVLQSRGDLEGALRAFREAESIDRRLYGDDHPRVATDTLNVGGALLRKGEANEALIACREAERISRLAYGSHHPMVSNSINTIGGALARKGDLDGALVAYQEAESIDRYVYGDEHPAVARAINNIGSIFQDKGDLERALGAYREAERITRKVYGDSHPDVALELNNIGTVLRDLGNDAQAIGLFSESLAMISDIQGPKSREALIGARNVASVGGDPIALVRERFGEDAARELAEALGAQAP